MAARRILVVYGTTDGQTGRIATRMAAHLKERGCLVAMFKGDSLASAYAPADFDGILSAPRSGMESTSRTSRSSCVTTWPR